MRKRIAIWALLFSLGVGAVPKRADAAIVLWVVSLGTGPESDTISDVSLGVCISGFLIWAIAGVLKPENATHGVAVTFVTVGAVLMTLDEEGIPSHDSLVQTLKTRYPKLQDHTALSDLAQVVRNQAKVISPDIEGKREIRIPEEITNRILEPSGILESSPELAAQITLDLG